MTTKEWLSRHDKQIAAHEKQIAAIRDLVKEGMRIVIKSRQDTRREIKDLTAAQARTEKSLKELIDSLRRSGGNGHAKTKVDLQ
jgi:DNA-binding FrmR family transcriptional regulator